MIATANALATVVMIATAKDIVTATAAAMMTVPR
jgi:hypothetical protein